jgi:cyanophycinase
MKGIKSTLFFLLPFFLLIACIDQVEKPVKEDRHGGKLFIIGGGKRPASMIAELIDIAGLKEKGAYTVVLPMASSVPDTSFYYFAGSLHEQNIDKVYNFNIEDASTASSSFLDSVSNAALVYITGGAQDAFMKVVHGTPLQKAILQAFHNGSVIAGTSAGAAVQGNKMITGNEYKHPEYTGEFRTIEAENLEIKEGLGLLPNAIIDQHFIWRMRMNRLVAAAIENPDEVLIGIDESTAIVVEGDSAMVTGLSQVVVVRNTKKIVREKNGLLGSEGMELNIYLPGERFAVHP